MVDPEQPPLLIDEEDPQPPAPAERLALLLDAGDSAGVVAYADELRPAELADALELLPDESRMALLTGVDPAVIGDALYYVEPHFRGELLRDLAPTTVTSMIAALADDVATDIVQDLDDATAEQVLAGLPAERRGAIERLLTHPEDTAGGRMTGQVVTVRPRYTAAQVLEALRAARPDATQPFYLYVTDERRRLLGVINLRALLTSPPDTPVTDMMITDVITVAVDADQEEAARLIKQYRLLALPVVDSSGRLVGTVTSDDLIDVLEDEATEDMFRMVGVHEEEDLRDIRRSVRYRLPWLSVNLVTVLAAGYIVSLFEDTIARVAVLAAFLPVIAGHGGNAGIQTLTVVVRSLALGRVTGRNVNAIVWHEVATGLVMGAVTGVIVAFIALIWADSAWLGLVVGVALTANVLVGVFFGTVIPMGLERLGQDPALSGGIWLTTTTDIIGFLVYLGLASILISRIA